VIHLLHVIILLQAFNKIDDVLLPGFRNVVIHEYVALDLRRVVEALDRLEPVDRFAEIVRSIEG